MNTCTECKHLIAEHGNKTGCDYPNCNCTATRNFLSENLTSNKQLHPKHYNLHPSGIECIEIVQHHNFNVGNAIKYLWRLGLKDGENELKELQKARNYIDFEIARITKES